MPELELVPDRPFFRCSQCGDQVPAYEFAGDKCLDCVQAEYEEAAQ